MNKDPKEESAKVVSIPNIMKTKRASVAYEEMVRNLKPIVEWLILVTGRKQGIARVTISSESKGRFQWFHSNLPQIFNCSHLDVSCAFLASDGGRTRSAA